jgi:hypothetical protein
MTPSDTQRHLHAVPMNLFPTFGSLRDVVDYAYSTLPVGSENDVFSLLMTYHNTLLAELNKDR